MIKGLVLRFLSFPASLGSEVHQLITICRAFTVSGKLKPEDAVRATLSSLPDEVVDTVGVTALPSEDSVSERRRKLEYLEMQEELIKVKKEDVFFILLSYEKPPLLF